jgi:hypothetical protein
VEGQVGAPGFIDDQRLAPAVADVGDGGDIGAGTVRCRADDQGAGRVRVPLPGLVHLLRRRRMRQMQVLVIARLDPLRPHPAEDQAGYHGFVRIPADQQLTLAAGHGQHRGFYRQGAAARGKEDRIRADGVGHQLLRPGQVAVRGLAVIQASRGQHVRTECVLADHGPGPRVRAAAPAGAPAA